MSKHAQCTLDYMDLQADHFADGELVSCWETEEFLEEDEDEDG